MMSFFLKKVITEMTVNKNFVPVRANQPETKVDSIKVQIYESDDETVETVDDQIRVEQNTDDSVITINDSSNSESDASTVVDETFSEVDDTTRDPDYVPTEEELHETTRFMRHQQFANYAACVAKHQSIDLDPLTVTDALSRSDAKKWKLAMKEEMNSLDENKTWSLTDLPPGRKAVKSKWVFKIKRDQSGNIVRHKARLVAKGYSQR